MSKKVSHHQAEYGAGTDKEHCSICTMYRAVATDKAIMEHPYYRPHCTKVEDPIEPYGVCKYFDPKRK